MPVFSTFVWVSHFLLFASSVLIFSACFLPSLRFV